MTARASLLKALGGAMVAAVVVVACSHASGAMAQAARRATSVTCGQRVTVIGVRGSGDPQSGNVANDKYGDSVHGMGKPGAAFAVALANRLPRGEVTFLPVIYPAVGLLGDWRKIINLVGAGAHIGLLGAYTGSVNDGKKMLRKEVSDEERICPKLKLVLVGYSQGAQVVADVYSRDLTAKQRSRIIGVVAFGDPYFNPADTAVDQGSYDPTRHGILGKRKLYPANHNAQVFSICHNHDPICQGPGRVAFSQHRNYQSDPWVKIAAAHIAAKLSTLRLTDTGVPGLRLGMRLDAIRRAGLIGALNPGCDLYSPLPFEATLRSPLGGVATFSGNTSSSKLIALEITAGAVTDRGIAIGSSAASVLRAYPGAIVQNSTEPLTFNAIAFSRAGKSIIWFFLDRAGGHVRSFALPQPQFCE